MLRRSAMRAANQLASAAPKRSATTAAGAVGRGAVLARSAAIFGAANSLGFTISALTGSHVHLDLLGTRAFAAMAVGTIEPTLEANTKPLLTWREHNSSKPAGITVKSGFVQY